MGGRGSERWQGGEQRGLGLKGARTDAIKMRPSPAEERESAVSAEMRGEIGGLDGRGSDGALGRGTTS